MRELTKYHSTHISDAFEERHQKLLAEVGEWADPENPDENRSKDILGRDYEYFLPQFAKCEGEERWAVRHAALYESGSCVRHRLREPLEPSNLRLIHRSGVQALDRRSPDHKIQFECERFITTCLGLMTNKP